MPELESIRRKIEQLDPVQLQMLSDFMGFLVAKEDGTLAPDAEYSADYTEWRNNLRKDVGFIEKHANNPVHMDTNTDFFTREEANKQ